MTSRPAPLSRAPDARGWLARRRGEPPSDGDASADASALFLVDLTAAKAALFEIEDATPRLSQDDESRIARMADRAAREQRRAAHIALRVLLERAAGPSIRARPYLVSSTGKPSLQLALDGAISPTAGSPPAGAISVPHFSLSHTRGCALIAVSHRGPIGVDIEVTRVPRIMGERRTAIERAAAELAGGVPLPADDRDARFLTAWVRLEAVAKADGAGLGAHLSIILGRRSAALPSAGNEGRDDGEGGRRTIVAHDLSLPSGLYGALACPLGMKVPELQGFPVERDAIEVLLRENASSDGTRR